MNVETVGNAVILLGGPLAIAVGVAIFDAVRKRWPS